MGTSPHGARPPSHTAYYVALGGIVLLLFLLCCYFFYFCVKRVKELTKDPESVTQPVSATPAPAAYPVQPAVRDSATAMAKLCKQLPQGGARAVFPAASSPAAAAADLAGKIPTSAAPTVAGRIHQGSVAAS